MAKGNFTNHKSPPRNASWRKPWTSTANRRTREEERRNAKEKMDDKNKTPTD